MELNALKSVMKEMGLNMKNFTPEIINKPFVEKKISAKKSGKSH